MRHTSIAAIIVLAVSLYSTSTFAATSGGGGPCSTSSDCYLANPFCQGTYCWYSTCYYYDINRCGNGYFDCYETCSSCPSDCPAPQITCGCGYGYDVQCCDQTIGNCVYYGVCSGNSCYTGSLKYCNTYCGDGSCNGGGTFSSCASDCGSPTHSC